MANYVTRVHYHLAWSVKYSAAALACFAASLMAWPTNAGLVALAVGYALAWLSNRERKRARAVVP